MDITDVRVKLVESTATRLRAFCSVVFDHHFVLHEVKVIEGKERLFVAMPSRPLTFRCPHCGEKNEVNFEYTTCEFCEQDVERTIQELMDKQPPYRQRRPYVDIFHPLNQLSRHVLEAAVLHAYEEELRKQEVVV